MYISQLSLTDFRSYAQADVRLSPGINVLIGPNGVGKTNIVEAIGYLANLSSHRVSNDGPLLRFGTERAVIRGTVHHADRVSSLEVEITSGKINKARINRANPVRAREILGIVRTVLFAPEDLSLIKSEPSFRRKFLDDLLLSLRPVEVGTKTDYDRIVKQRNALLKSVRGRSALSTSQEATLQAWDLQLAATGARIMRGRLKILELLEPYMAAAYADLADGAKTASMQYLSSISSEGPTAELDHSELPQLGQDQLQELLLQALEANRSRELERGITLFGPHRDDLALYLGHTPAKGYASHGETWSFALALRLAAYRVFGDDDPRPGAGPILILDDVFAELDATRRDRLAHIVAGAEQVLVTAAVPEDVPKALKGAFFQVSPGQVDDA
ncbi:DNA replication/repair protein RecF [Glutamicibacter sp. MNS18]|uniref:DNA replication/repair protein RecF n=1 Tax=Glutamicibacter sp. MNS18 TaxID=2989817 RepID=UPI00223596E6|nr:DNA replication/repair protein RecF [Glutamicibacter sp. MNS18]MCW4466635.1 DNA replication/repair protein RecF [Glutamicibacter sp. MNS18]